MKGGKTYLYGRHALYEALLNVPQIVRKVYFASSMDDAKLRALVKKNQIPTAELREKEVREKVDGGGSHQGVVAHISTERLVMPYKEFVAKVSVSPDTLLLLLDEIQDPHNVGAIIRSAAAFGAAGVLLPEHKQAGVTGAVIKVSAGMAFRVPLVSVGNVNTTLRDLKERGFWIYGLAGDAKQSVREEKFDAPVVLLLGNESEGIRQKTKTLCDDLLAIPTHPRAESLNVAASAAVALYAWSVKHPSALRLS